MAGLLYAREHRINDFITINIPTVGEVLDNEDTYNEIICTIIGTPYDMMVQLDDAGIDFTKINDFELFCLMFSNLQELDTSLVFKNLDLKGFRTAISEQNGNVVLWDEATGATIDLAIHHQIAAFVRNMLKMKRETKRPGNEEARKYMIERARVKQKRMKRKRQETSQMEEFILALVNTEEFKYNFETVRDITIYQFYASLHQVTHKIRFDNSMTGYYAGAIKFEDLPKEDRSWIQTT